MTIHIKNNPLLAACFEGGADALKRASEHLETPLDWRASSVLLDWVRGLKQNQVTLVYQPNEVSEILAQLSPPNRPVFFATSRAFLVEQKNPLIFFENGSVSVLGNAHKPPLILNPLLAGARALTDNKFSWINKPEVHLASLEAATQLERVLFDPLSASISQAINVSRQNRGTSAGITANMLTIEQLEHQMNQGVQALAKAPLRGRHSLEIGGFFKNGTHIVIQEKTFADNIVKTSLDATKPFYVQKAGKGRTLWLKVTASLAKGTGSPLSPLELASFFVHKNSPVWTRLQGKFDAWDITDMTDSHGVYALRQDLLDAILKPRSLGLD